MLKMLNHKLKNSNMLIIIAVNQGAVDFVVDAGVRLNGIINFSEKGKKQLLKSLKGRELVPKMAR